MDATYTFFKFDIKNPGLAVAGQSIVPNTPKNKGSVALTYTGLQGFDAAVDATFTERHEWNAGVFVGHIPSSQTVNLDVGYRINIKVRAFAHPSNLLDQRRFRLYGGSVIGRRILTGLTANF